MVKPLYARYRAYPGAVNFDRIILPQSAQENANACHSKHHYHSGPLIYRLHSQISGRTSHSAAQSFTAEEGVITMPKWMMDNLGVQNSEEIIVMRTCLPNANVCIINSYDIKELTVDNQKQSLHKLLEGLCCLTVGDRIQVPTQNGNNFEVTVTETIPDAAVNITACTFETNVRSSKENVIKTYERDMFFKEAAIQQKKSKTTTDENLPSDTILDKKVLKGGTYQPYDNESQSITNISQEFDQNNKYMKKPSESTSEPRERRSERSMSTSLSLTYVLTNRGSKRTFRDDTLARAKVESKWSKTDKTNESTEQMSSEVEKDDGNISDKSQVTERESSGNLNAKKPVFSKKSDKNQFFKTKNEKNRHPKPKKGKSSFQRIISKLAFFKSKNKPAKDENKRNEQISKTRSIIRHKDKCTNKDDKHKEADCKIDTCKRTDSPITFYEAKGAQKGKRRVTYTKKPIDFEYINRNEHVIIPKEEI